MKNLVALRDKLIDAEEEIEVLREDFKVSVRKEIVSALEALGHKVSLIGDPVIDEAGIHFDDQGDDGVLVTARIYFSHPRPLEERADKREEGL